MIVTQRMLNTGDSKIDVRKCCTYFIYLYVITIKIFIYKLVLINFFNLFIFDSVAALLFDLDKILCIRNGDQQFSYFSVYMILFAFARKILDSVI